MPHAEPGDFGPSGGRLVGDQASNLSLTLIVLDAICIGTNKMEITKLFFFCFGFFLVIFKLSASSLLGSGNTVTSLKRSQTEQSDDRRV